LPDLKPIDRSALPKKYDPFPKETLWTLGGHRKLA